MAMRAKRKYNTPKINSAGIRFGKQIGKGQNPNYTFDVRKAKVSEFESVEGEKKLRKRFSAVAKKLVGGKAESERIKRQILADSQRAWRSFKRAGLPVPSFSRVVTKKGHPQYLTLFAENMQTTRGKINELHKAGEPIGFRKLSVEKHRKLIADMAKDLATIHNLGYSTMHLDFWHIYKRGKITERVIVDFAGFSKENKAKTSVNARMNFIDLKNYFGEKEFALFLREYEKHSKKELPNFV